MPNVVKVSQPERGQIVHYKVAGVDVFNLDFSLNEVEVVKKDGSIYFVFPDGSTIVIEDVFIVETPPSFLLETGEIVAPHTSLFDVDLRDGNELASFTDVNVQAIPVGLNVSGGSDLQGGGLGEYRAANPTFVSGINALGLNGYGSATLPSNAFGSIDTILDGNGAPSNNGGGGGNTPSGSVITVPGWNELNGGQTTVVNGSELNDTFDKLYGKDVSVSLDAGSVCPNSGLVVDTVRGDIVVDTALGGEILPGTGRLEPVISALNEKVEPLKGNLGQTSIDSIQSILNNISTGSFITGNSNAQVTVSGTGSNGHFEDTVTININLRDYIQFGNNGAVSSILAGTDTGKDAVKNVSNIDKLGDSVAINLSGTGAQGAWGGSSAHNTSISGSHGEINNQGGATTITIKGGDAGGRDIFVDGTNSGGLNIVIDDKHGDLEHLIAGASGKNDTVLGAINSSNIILGSAKEAQAGCHGGAPSSVQHDSSDTVKDKDILMGGNKADIILAANGDNLLVGQRPEGADDVISTIKNAWKDATDDVGKIAAMAGFVSTLSGGDGDYIIAGSGNNTVLGSSGDDIIQVGTDTGLGKNFIATGAGDDSVFLQGASNGTTHINLGGGKNYLQAENTVSLYLDTTVTDGTDTLRLTQGGAVIVGGNLHGADSTSGVVIDASKGQSLSLSVTGGIANTTVMGGTGTNVIKVDSTMQSGSIKTNDGNDIINIGGMAGGSIDSGGGSDMIGIVGGAMAGGTIDAGVGGDTVSIWESSVSKGGSISAGDGDDSIMIITSSVGGGVIDAGKGNDIVYVFESIIKDGTINTNEGNDVVNLSSVTISGGIINADKGDDSILLDNVTLIGGTIDAGDGNDTLEVKGNFGSTGVGTSVSLGDDNDMVHITGDMLGGLIDLGASGGGTPAGHTLELCAGLGNKTATVTGDFVSIAGEMQGGSISLMGDGNNGVAIDGKMSNGTISTGAGKDVIKIATITGGSISTGEGDDTICITHIAGGTIDAGAGNDTLCVQGDYSVGAGGGASVSLGEGNDYLHIAGNMLGGTIDLGINSTTPANHTTLTLCAGLAPDNTVPVTGDFVHITGNMLGGAISLTGDAQDIVNGVHIEKTMSSGTITTGAGKDVIKIATITGGSISTGAGVDTVCIASMDGGVINTENGEDTVCIENMSSGTVSTDAGTDSVYIKGTISGGTIDTGADNDTVHIAGTVNGGASIVTGTGDDSVTINAMAGGKVDTGDGADLITIKDMTKGSVDTGKDNDSITIGNMSGGIIKADEGNDIIISGGMTGGTIDAGAGQDKITITGNVANAIIDGGDGSDYIVIDGNFGNAGNTSSNNTIIKGGVGVDNVTIKGIFQKAEVDLGDNNDYISIGTMQVGAVINAGDGADKITIGNMHDGIINTGNGEDTIIIDMMEGGTINTASGQDSVGDRIEISTMNGGTLNGGDGRDSIAIDSMTSGTISTQDGEDSVVIDSFTDGTVDLGKGNDYLAVGIENVAKDSGTINLGEGSDTIRINYTGTGDITAKFEHFRNLQGSGDTTIDLSGGNPGRINFELGTLDDFNKLQCLGADGKLTIKLGADDLLILPPDWEKEWRFDGEKYVSIKEPTVTITILGSDGKSIPASSATKLPAPSSTTLDFDTVDALKLAETEAKATTEQNVATVQVAGLAIAGAVGSILQESTTEEHNTAKELGVHHTIDKLVAEPTLSFEHVATEPVHTAPEVLHASVVHGVDFTLDHSTFADKTVTVVEEDTRLSAQEGILPEQQDAVPDHTQAIMQGSAQTQETDAVAKEEEVAQKAEENTPKESTQEQNAESNTENSEDAMLTAQEDANNAHELDTTHIATGTEDAIVLDYTNVVHTKDILFENTTDIEREDVEPTGGIYGIRDAMEWYATHHAPQVVEIKEPVVPVVEVQSAEEYGANIQAFELIQPSQDLMHAEEYLF